MPQLSGVCHAICNGQDQFEVKQWNNRFIVDLQKKECSCRYWQLFGLPCARAISCIFFKTNNLDDYTAKCYTIEEFHKTCSYCLMLVEGMQNWPKSDRPPLQAPGYVRMPGRPKKERKREEHEKPKAPKLSRVGTVVRCRKCKQIGHNRSTCDKRNAPRDAGDNSGSAQRSTAAANMSNPAQHESPLVVSTQQSSSAATRKRKASTTCAGTTPKSLGTSSTKKLVS
jgi:hypothetical protein